MFKYLFLTITLIIVVSCTDDGQIYDSNKHSKEDFSGENTAGLLLGLAIIGAAANSGYGGAPLTDYDWDWDYLPGSGQWRCRGIQTGEFADSINCLYDTKDDDRWP